MKGRDSNAIVRPVGTLANTEPAVMAVCIAMPGSRQREDASQFHQAQPDSWKETEFDSIRCFWLETE